MVVDDIHVLIVILAGDSNGLASHTLSSMQEFLPRGRKEKKKKIKKEKEKESRQRFMVHIPRIYWGRLRAKRKA